MRRILLGGCIAVEYRYGDKRLNALM